MCLQYIIIILLRINDYLDHNPNLLTFITTRKTPTFLFYDYSYLYSVLALGVLSVFLRTQRRYYVYAVLSTFSIYVLVLLKCLLVPTGYKFPFYGFLL